MKNNRVIKLKELAKELREYQTYINSTTNKNKESKNKKNNNKTK